MQMCIRDSADGKVRLAPRRPPTVRQLLLDYYRCLQRWRIRYAPQSPTEELHPCFLEAIKNLDIVEYYLDCSVPVSYTHLTNRPRALMATPPTMQMPSSQPVLTFLRIRVYINITMPRFRRFGRCV